MAHKKTRDFSRVFGVDWEAFVLRQIGTLVYSCPFLNCFDDVDFIETGSVMSPFFHGCLSVRPGPLQTSRLA
ncbi:MAG: hypothetical protein DSY87_07510 [Methylococcus sp.]|nr:MAG: hypothetical protein DSY87_07510 [Methylococcus sp.]